MRVSIEIEPRNRTRGFIFKKTETWVEVQTTVEFNEEELTIIRDNNLGDVIVLEREPDHRLHRVMGDMEPHYWDLRIAKLVKNKPEKYTVANLAAANIYRAEVEEALRNLKEFINQNAAPREATKFEL